MVKRNVSVDGVLYKVAEDLGYSHSVGADVVIVETSKGERTAVRQDGYWQWWTPADRTSRPAGRMVGQ